MHENEWNEPMMSHEQNVKNSMIKIGVLSTALTLSLGLALAPCCAAEGPEAPENKTAQAASNTLSSRQQTIPLIAAAMATSDMPKLNTALNQGLDAGLGLPPPRRTLSIGMMSLSEVLHGT